MMEHHVTSTRTHCGEKLTLTIDVTREDGEQLQYTLAGLHTSTTPQQIDNVINGALLLASCPPQPNSPLLMSSSEESSIKIEQIPSLKQWHSSTCGYHALFNVRNMLLGVRDATEVEFWALVFHYIGILTQEPKWQHVTFIDAMLDEVHMEYLIQADPVLCGNCTMFGDPAFIESKAQLEQPPLQVYRHAYLLVCSSHWISAAWTSKNVLSVMDSHNKNLSLLRTPQDSADMALQVVEDYRAEFCAKMMEVHQYQHYPMSLINNMYDSGVPEYWKGKLKDSLYWTHRPAKVRRDIMFRELESIRAYLDAFRGEASYEEQCLLPRRVVFKETSQVFTQLTEQRFPAYVRREEDLPVVDHAAPASMQNRKRAPMEEIKGDAFDRQRTIPGFDQSKVESQVCLVVGTGGIGMNVALTLCRLGVKEICLVDYDTYDASNLTRQCLGTKQDVGERKTNVALRNIEAHNLRTNVRALDANVITEWRAVCSEARKCTVVFNCCDAGKMLDFALNSLCKELCIPYCSGQSFGWKFMSEFYTSQAELNCAFCEESTESTFSLNQSPQVLKRWKEFKGGDLADFLQSDAAFQIDSRFVREFATSLPVLDNAKDMLRFLQGYHDWCIEKLLPHKVSLVDSLAFCAWPKQVSTRYVGSWVCPCLACGVFCVSHWTNYLTSMNRNPPTCMLFNLDEGMSAEEQMGYDFQLCKEDRSFANTPSRTSCKTCACAQAHKRDMELFFGTDKVWLRPVPGEVSSPPAWDFDTNGCTVEEKLTHIKQSSELLKPRIPAVPPKRVVTLQLQQDGLNADWPNMFAYAPMLKTSEENAREWPGAVQGINSGIRSSIVFDSKRAIRLKGCGNNLEAFPLEIKGDDGVSKSLRGCMFEETCARELYMTEYLEQRCGVPCGNKPLGYFRYSKQMPSKDLYFPSAEWKWEDENEEKFCGVFETLGEKRLGDCLLGGLELVLLDYVDKQAPVEQQKQWWDAMQPMFTHVRQTDFDTATQVECALQCVDFSMTFSALDSKLHLVMQLARVLGKECGSIMRQLHEHRVCWGTFPDEMGIHCNAHANNVIVVFNPTDTVNFLAAVDFDFAFTESSFVENAWEGKDSLFPKDFEGILQFEQTMGMKTSLAGCDFSSTGVVNQQQEEEASECFRLMKIALRDTVVVAYEQALVAETETSPTTQAWRAEAYTLIKLALRATAT